MPETYPQTIHKLPTHFGPNNHTVLAWVMVKNREGNYPGGYVLAHNPAEVQPYVVTRVCTRDGGETWQGGGQGYYWGNFDNALEDFTDKLGGSDIAPEALTEPEPCEYAEPTEAKAIAALTALNDGTPRTAAEKDALRRTIGTWITSDPDR